MNGTFYLQSAINETNASPSKNSIQIWLQQLGDCGSTELAKNAQLMIGRNLFSGLDRK